MSILDRDLVTVTGPDAFSFLQSLVSQNVEGLDDGAVVSSLLLTPKGKVQFAFRVVRVGDDAWLDVDAGYGEGLANALLRYKLRVKIEISTPDEPWGMVAIRGESFELIDDVPATCRVLPVGWSTTVGVDVIGPQTDLGSLGPRGLDAEEYERARLEAGMPRLGPDLDESTIPQEAWLDRDSVSFTKGCYLGQELVARIDSRDTSTACCAGSVRETQPRCWTAMPRSRSTARSSDRSRARSRGSRSPTSAAKSRRRHPQPSPAPTPRSNPSPAAPDPPQPESAFRGWA